MSQKEVHPKQLAFQIVGGELTIPLVAELASLVSVAEGMQTITDYATAEPKKPKPHFAARKEDSTQSAFESFKKREQVIACENSVKNAFVGGLLCKRRRFFLMNTALLGVRGGCVLGVTVTDLSNQQVHLELKVDKKYEIDEIRTTLYRTLKRLETVATRQVRQ